MGAVVRTVLPDWTILRRPALVRLVALMRFLMDGRIWMLTPCNRRYKPHNIHVDGQWMVLIDLQVFFQGPGRCAHL